MGAINRSGPRTDELASAWQLSLALTFSRLKSLELSSSSFEMLIWQIVMGLFDVVHEKATKCSNAILLGGSFPLELASLLL